LPIPVAVEDERVVVAIALVFPTVGRQLLEEVSLDDLYEPRHRRLVEAALHPGTQSPECGADETPLEARVRVIADTASERHYLLSLASDYAALGSRRQAARAVRDAARRRAMLAAARTIVLGAAEASDADLHRAARQVAELAGVR
jgi:replicative DNA helicase